MSSILTRTLIILSAIIMTIVKRKIIVHRRIKAKDRIVKEIVDKIGGYAAEKEAKKK